MGSMGYMDVEMGESAFEEPKNAGQTTESGDSQSSDLAEESALQHLNVC